MTSLDFVTGGQQVLNHLQKLDNFAIQMMQVLGVLDLKLMALGDLGLAYSALAREVRVSPILLIHLPLLVLSFLF